MEPITGKEFERRIVYQLDLDEKAGRCSAGRYGVQATFHDGVWRPIQSLPDFEGIIAPSGRQFVFDAKVCSGPSFQLQDSTFEKRQKRHLYSRARAGAISFLLLHFNERVLKKRTDEAMTIAFPVYEGCDFWRKADAAEVKSINREDAAWYGVLVSWTDGRGKPRPLVMDAVLHMAEYHFPLRLEETA